MGKHSETTFECEGEISLREYVFFTTYSSPVNLEVGLGVGWVGGGGSSSTLRSNFQRPDPLEFFKILPTWTL